MTKNQVLKLFSLMANAYPNFKVSEDKLEDWTDILEHQDYEKVRANLKRHIQNERFIPTPSEIMDHAPKEEESFLTKIDEWRKNAATPEVAQKALEEIREMLNG
ncbi:replicative helicase loader/inhibitor [Ammoniphilus sp. YIM 78166]|uniref:replicative helicase loader/inhibitor n=1 Tax=Ammoniphilus sp. YIM 78166 TaxID=1644106 RepID=UPI00106F338D|nr:replicative helicase loader/inhibitor [Ammoniphilus sp. YIM 78166]